MAGITVRELVTKLTIGGNASEKLAKFGLAVNGVKAGLDIMVGTLKRATDATFGLVDGVTQAGDAIAKTSRQVGLTARSFQRLSFAADRSGLPLVNLKKGLQNIERNLRDATIAAGKNQQTGFTRALADVGLRLKDLEGLNAEERLGLLGEALSEVADEGRRVALSQKLIGEEAGPMMASLLAEGREGIKALGDEAERLGIVLDDNALSASEAFQDSLTNARAVLQGFKNQLAIGLLPTVKGATDGFKDFLLQNRKLIQQNITKLVMKLGEAFQFGLEHLGEFVEMVTLLVDLLIPLASGIAEVVESLGGLENVIRGAAAAWIAYKTAALAATVGLSLTPLGLLAIALGSVALAFADIETNAEKARKARIKFQSGTSESDKPADDALATSDARKLAASITGEGPVDESVINRLSSPETSAIQVSATLRKARNMTFDAAEFAPSMKSDFLGMGAPTSSSGVAKRNNAAVAGFIDQIEKEIIENRKRAAADAAFDPTRPSDFFPGGIVPGVGTGSRQFKPFSVGDGKKDTDEDLNKLIADAIKSGKLPESAALLASTQPPIIVTVTNNNMEVNVDAPVSIDGAGAESVEGFVEQVKDIMEEGWTQILLNTMDQVRPQESR